MSDAATFAIAQALQGLAGAGGDVADVAYKNQMSEYESRKARDRLAQINKRVQELVDENSASVAGTSLEEMTGSLDPVARDLYGNLAPAAPAQPQSLAAKIRGVANYPVQNGPEITPPGGPAPAPTPQASSSPAWERRLNEILMRDRPKQNKTVQNALTRTAALLQASQEMGVAPDDLKKIADSGDLLRDLTKDVTESADKLTTEQTKTGTEYRQQTSQDRRQAEEIKSREELAALERAMREKIARMQESGKNARAQKLAETWKAQVAATNAITTANDKQQGRMISAIKEASKIRDPNAKAALLSAAGVPFDPSYVKESWWNPWSDTVLAAVTPHPERANELYLDPNRLQRQLHIKTLRSLLPENEDPNGDPFEDPINPPVVLPSRNGAQGSTLPGANPSPKPFR